MHQLATYATTFDEDYNFLKSQDELLYRRIR